MTGPDRLTRYDFEALLWDFLSRHLDQPQSELLTDVQSIYGLPTLTVSELVEFCDAVATVKHLASKRVWKP